MKRVVLAGLAALCLLGSSCGEETLPVDPSQPLTAPREPPMLARAPVRDVPFVQDTNHLPVPTDRAGDGMVALVWPPDSFGPQWRRPLPVTARGVRASDAPRAIEPASGARYAATSSTHLVLAASSEVFVVDNAGREVRRDSVGATVVGLVTTPDSVVATTTVSSYAVFPDRAPVRIGEPAVFGGDASLFCRATARELECAPSSAPAPSLRAALPAAIGAPLALVTRITLPLPLEVVVFGTTGIAAFDAAGAQVQVPLFASGRVPYEAAHQAVRMADGGFTAITTRGAMRVRSTDEWRVYNADRWLPHKDVRAVATRDGELWFATMGGLSRVTSDTLTLEEKLAPFVTRILERHDRDGAVADSHLTTRGDLTTNIPWDSDNDASWTSYWVRGECYRWKVTGDPAAKAHFDKSLDAMLKLRDLTGTDHFVARAVIRKAGCRLDDCDHPDDGEWFTSPDGEWWVKGDTSNDEIAAQMSFMGVAYDLCADEPQRQRIREHIGGIVRGIVENGWQLVDLDGLVTRYGQFDPAYTKESIPGMVGDGGVRALELLAALTLAHYLTGDVYFHDAKRRLIDEHGYDVMTERELEYPARKTHMDNDEMAVFSWMALLRYEPDPALHARWLRAWTSNWEKKFSQQQGAWWIAIHASVGGQDPPLEEALRWLQRAPVDMVRWNMVNLDRRDLTEADPEWFDDGALRSDGRIIPYDERACDRWNTDQFRADSARFDGAVEMDGADVLDPYWMARYYGWITK